MKLFKRNRLCGWILATSVLLRASEMVDVLAETETWNDEATPQEASDSNSRSLTPVSDGVQGDAAFGPDDTNEPQKKPLATGHFHQRASGSNARRLQPVSDRVQGSAFGTNETSDPEKKPLFTNVVPYEDADAKEDRDSSIAARRTAPSMPVVSKTQLIPTLLRHSPPFRVRMQVEGTHAYLGVDRSNKVLIYDISDRAAPEYVAFIDTCFGRNIHDLWVSGDHLWTAHRFGGLSMINILDIYPRKPVMKPSCFEETYCHKGLISEGNYLFYSGYYLSIYEITGDYSLRLTSRSSRIPGDGWEVVTNGNYAYVVSDNAVNAPVNIYDISNKRTAPYLVGSFRPPGGKFPPYEMIVSRDRKRLYATARDASGYGEGFYIFDIDGANAANPKLLGGVTNHPLAFRIALDDENSILYVKDHWGKADISAYEVQDATSPILVGWHEFPHHTVPDEGGNGLQDGGLWYSNGYVYTVNGNDLVILRAIPLSPFCKGYALFNEVTKTPLTGSCYAYDKLYQDLCPPVNTRVANPQYLPPGGNSPTCPGYCCGNWGSGGTCPFSPENSWRKPFPTVIVPACDGKERPGECEVVLQTLEAGWPVKTCSVREGNWIFPSISCWTGNDSTSNVLLGVNTKVTLCHHAGECARGGTTYTRTRTSGPFSVPFPGLSELRVECA